MKPTPAFQFNGLAVLLSRTLSEPADQADNDAINAALTRRGTACSAGPAEEQRREQNRTPLHLVPDIRTTITRRSRAPRDCTAA
jgi:hypothetical protein